MTLIVVTKDWFVFSYQDTVDESFFADFQYLEANLGKAWLSECAVYIVTGSPKREEACVWLEINFFNENIYAADGVIPAPDITQNEICYGITGNESPCWQRVAVDFRQVAQNAATVFVKVEHVSPDEIDGTGVARLRGLFIVCHPIKKHIEFTKEIEHDSRRYRAYDQVKIQRDCFAVFGRNMFSA
jgi:hypothetical protein